MYERVSGWNCAIGELRTWSDLPREAKCYITRLEQLMEIPIRWVSLGPERSSVIRRGETDSD